MDEAALVETARADPGRGFAAIYERYRVRIHDYCLAVLRQREDAADAAQETFVVAYERLGQLREPDRLTPWLYAIARSRCLRRLRDRTRQQPTADLEPWGTAEPAGTGGVEVEELRRLVWEAAAGLADDDRAVLDLHLRHGLHGTDLADALGVPPEKASLMLHRMKQRMGRAIGALLVARTGRRDCPQLATLATGRLTPLTRKRLARHVERCRVCRERRDRLTPELLYASVPLAPVPSVVDTRITDLIGSGTGTGFSDGLRWRADGFPADEPVRASPPLPRRSLVGAGTAATVVLGVLGGWLVHDAVAGTDPDGSGPTAAVRSATHSPTAAAVPGPAPDGSVTPGAAGPTTRRPEPGTPATPVVTPTAPVPPSPPDSSAPPAPSVPPPTVVITRPTDGHLIDNPYQPVILQSERHDPLGQGLDVTWSATYPYDPASDTGGVTETVSPVPLSPTGARWVPVDTFGQWCESSGQSMRLRLTVRDDRGRVASDQVVLRTAPCPTVR